MKKMSLILHSNDFDKMMSALILANGALAMGHEVSIFFTFWGLMLLKRHKLASGGLSKMNLWGLGKRFIQQRMKKQHVADAETLMNDFKSLGGRIIACDMTMDIMGLKKEQLNTDIIDEFGGVGTYINESADSQINLFI